MAAAGCATVHAQAQALLPVLQESRVQLVQPRSGQLLGAQSSARQLVLARLLGVLPLADLPLPAPPLPAPPLPPWVVRLLPVPPAIQSPGPEAPQFPLPLPA